MGSTLIVDEIQGATTAANVQFPAGVVIQSVDASHTGTTTVQNTTFTDTGLTLSITPKFATSKILVTCTQNIQAWNTGAYATARWRIMRNIGGGAFTAIYQDSSSTNGNIFYYDYGGSGINCYTPVSYTMIDTPTTTSACIYKTQGCQGSNGGNRATFDENAPGRIVLMEIAG
tara:strand:- start:860 stop:1378 length:519 start_codon:yes stop_codon:yes gene_type:complete